MKKKIAEPVGIILITAIIYICILVIKSVYPFGTESFIFKGDGYQQNLATLYYLWDTMHFDRDLFFDFSMGYGSNMIGVVSHFGMLSPFNLILFFIPRNYIITFYTWSTLARLICAALAVRLFLKSLYEDRLSTKVVILLSLMYSFSSWFMKYIAFPQWQDEAVLLPLLLYFTVRLLKKEGKSYGMGYPILLAAVLIVNIQSAYAIILYLILFSGMFIVSFIKERDERRRAIFRLGYHTIIGALLGCCIFLPAAYQITHSAREGEDIIFRIKCILRSNSHPDTTYALDKLMIYSSECLTILLALAGLIYRRVTKCRFDTRVLGSFLLFVFVSIPVFCEGIHYVWMGGEYVCFPLRMGEIIFITGIMLLAVLIGENEKCLKLFEKGIAGIVISVVWLGLIIYGAYDISSKHVVTGDLSADPGMYYYGNRFYGEDEALIHHDPLVRYKDTKMGGNLSMISCLSSGGNYLQVMSANAIHANRRLGYHQTYTRMSDKGGTPFTDALLGYRYTISDGKFTGINAVVFDDMVITENEIVYPFGLFIEGDHDLTGDDFFEDYGIVNLHNMISTDVTGCSYFTAATEYDSYKEEYDEDGNRIITFDVPDNLEDELYVYLEDIEGDETYEISVDGRVKEIGAGFWNMGVHTSLIKVQIPGEYDGRVDLATFDRKAFENSIPRGHATKVMYTKDTLLFDIENYNSDEREVFIPISYDKGWRCRIDGHREDIKCIYGNFMAITVPADKLSHVVLEYHSPFRFTGAVLTMIGIIVLFLEWRMQLCEFLMNKHKTMNMIMSIIFWMIFAGLVLGMILCGVVRI